MPETDRHQLACIRPIFTPKGIKVEIAEIQRFVDRGNYHAAYNIALSGMNACHREGDQAGVDQFISTIRDIVDSLAAEFGSPRAD